MKIYLTILFLTFCSLSKAQIDSNSTKKNVVYLEILGTGGYGSLNFEREIFKLKTIKFSFRIGLSSYNLTDYTTKFNPDILIPFSVNALYGNKHNLEFGIGQVIANIVEADPISFNPRRTTNIHANFTIGYRYQKIDGGIMFRIGYTPIIEFYEDYQHWGGISIGYSF